MHGSPIASGNPRFHPYAGRKNVSQQHKRIIIDFPRLSTGRCFLMIIALAVIQGLYNSSFLLRQHNNATPCIHSDRCTVALDSERKDVVLSAAKPRSPIFYNLFVKDESDVVRVSRMVKEQLSMMNPIHHGIVYVNAIGVPLPEISNSTNPNVVMLQQTEQGTELDILDAVWNYCKSHTEENIIYLHSKGSLTPAPENDRLRDFLTRGALSEDCAQLPETCNVCSSRMSPLPHPHTSGNMWLARCSYIQNLTKPHHFRRQMGVKGYSCVGAGRYAAEHWVHSHPAVRPCDLYTQPDFVWNYDGVPSISVFAHNMKLAAAPRFAMEQYRKPGSCDGHGTIQHRLDEYKRIYHVTPDGSWWGWKFFNESKANFQ